MADPFLDEVKRMHRVRDCIRRLSPEQRAQFARTLGDDAANDLVLRARDAQLPPPDLDWCWLYCGGRGGGKSWAVSGAVHTAIRAGLKRIALVAPTSADYLDTNLEGPSGLLATCDAGERPRFISHRKRLEWSNGARVIFYSGEEPESLRGPNTEMCISAGTPVTMADGSCKPIEDIVLGDQVATPIGPRRVLWQGKTRRNAETILIRTEENHVRLTPDHRVYVEGRGWGEAEKIQPGDHLIVFNTAASGGGVIAREVTTGRGVRAANRSCFTDRSTKTILDRSRLAATFITRMKTLAITTQAICNASRSMITSAFTARSRSIRHSVALRPESQYLKRSVANHPIQRSAFSAVVRTRRAQPAKVIFAQRNAGASGVVQGSRNISAWLNDFVKNVVRSMWLGPHTRSIAVSNAINGRLVDDIDRGVKLFGSSAPNVSENLNRSAATHGSVVESALPCFTATVLQVEAGEKSDCYDITVDEAGCFFAGGILVHNCIIDELAKMKYQQRVFDNAMFINRIGDKPRILIATTPKTTDLMKDLFARKGVSITTGSTFENARHLSKDFLDRVRSDYEGTRTGRQELYGELILNPENALFRDEWIVRQDHIPSELIERVTVGVDPAAGTNDMIGIVVPALLTDGRLAVLADRSLNTTAARWGDAVVKAHDDFDADDVVVEMNFGGAMAVDVVKQAALRMYQEGKRETDTIRVKEVQASRGKVMRAEPVSLQYEKGRVIHVRGLEALEKEMFGFSRDWDPNVNKSPNRLDALVWGMARLLKIKTHIPIAA